MSLPFHSCDFFFPSWASLEIFFCGWCPSLLCSEGMRLIDLSIDRLIISGRFCELDWEGMRRNERWRRWLSFVVRGVVVIFAFWFWFCWFGGAARRRMDAGSGRGVSNPRGVRVQAPLVRFLVLVFVQFFDVGSWSVVVVAIFFFFFLSVDLSVFPPWFCLLLICVSGS